MSTRGGIVNVRTEPLGDELAAAVIVGAVTLTLTDVADFEEADGVLQIGSEVVGYSTADDETGIVKLDTPLATAYAVAEPVYAYPLGTTTTADVVVEDGGDPISARVPLALIALLPDGVRSGADEQEAVDLERVGLDWVVGDVVGKTPVIDASFTDPGTLPEDAPEIPDAPSGSPTPTVNAFSVLALEATWDAEARATDYDVYVSPAGAGFTADATTYFGTTVNTRLVVTRDPLADARLLPVPYWVKVVAWNAGGRAAASAAGSGTPRQADVEEISALFAYLGDVQAGQIRSGVMDADVSVSGSFSVADYDEDTGLPIPGTEKARLDNTFRMWDADGVERIAFYPDARAFTFRGDVEADHLTVVNGSLQGGANELAEGATLTLAKGVTNPKAPPSFLIDYDGLQLTGFTGIIGFGGLTKVGAFWYVAGFDPANGAPAIFKFDAATGAQTAVGSANAAVGPSGDKIGGIVYNGVDFYVLVGVANTIWTVVRFDGTTLAGVDASNWQHMDGADIPTIGWDSAASEILIAQSRPSNADKVRVRRYTFHTGANLDVSATAAVDCTTAFNKDLAGVLFGSFDFGASRYVFVRKGPGAVQSMTTGGVEQGGEEWPASAEARGLYWDGANFWSLDNSRVLRKYEAGAGNRWTTSTDENWWLAYTWRRATGSLETQRSPYAPVVMVKRARLTVQTPPLPVGGSTPPSEARVYLKKGTTNPGSNVATVNMRSQGSTTGSPPTLVVVNADFGASNNPAANGFGTAGSPAVLQDGDGLELLSADSTWLTYTPALTASGTNPVLGSSTISGRYKRIGKLVRYEIILTIVTGGAFNAGVGAWRFGLPPIAPLATADRAHGSALIDAASKTGGYTVGIATSTSVTAWGSAGAVGAASPAAPANGNKYILQGSYEAA